MLSRKPTTSRPDAVLAQSAFVRYRTAVLNPDGSIASERTWKKNLILDVGLDQVAAQDWVDCFQYAAVGTGTNPTLRDSGATTFSRSGTTVTASAAFFEAADVGRLLKFDSGEEMYVTAFTSTTEVTVNISGTLGASPGTIYYVNDTALQTESKRTNTYRTDSGDNGSTWGAVNAEWTHKRTFIFSAEAGPVTYNEVGWSWGANPTVLFGRDVFSSGDSLVAGQQYLIVCELVVRYSPATSTAVGDVGSGGFDTSGNASVECVDLFSVQQVNASTGASNGNTVVLEPSYTGTAKQVQAYTGAVTLGGATNSVVTPPANVAGTAAGSSYVSGNFYRDFSFTFSVAQANGTITGLGIGSADRLGFAVDFTAGQTKANTHTLAVTFRISWGRRLTN